MRALAFVLALAGCGNQPTTTAPRAKAPVRLVRCTAALPPPQAKGDEILRTITNPTNAWNVTTRRDRLVVGTRATVTLGLVTVRNGPLTVEQATGTMRTKLADLKACYSLEVSTVGRLVPQFRITIGADGSVVHTDTMVGTLSSTLDTCIRRTFRSTRFPNSSGSSTVVVPLVFDTGGAFANAPKAPPTPAEPWTPFAVGTVPPNPAAFGAARATEAMARARLDELDKCFVDPALTGSLRVLLEIDIAGEIAGIRPGGLGDRNVEACAAKALSGVRVMTPLQEHVEVACDFARGDAQPWRVTPTAGYKVIDVDGTKLVHADETLAPGTSDPPPLPADTYVVLAKSDTLGGMLQLALMWARDANAVLLAVADGRPAPLFLGMANTGDTAEEGVPRATVRVGAKTATGCIGRSSHKAAVTSTTELGTMMQKLWTKCRSAQCTATLAIAVDSDAIVRDLLEVAGAARRAGFDRVLFGGTEFGCRVEVPQTKSKPVPEPEFEGY